MKMKFDINIKIIGEALRQVLLLLVSVVCIYLLVSQLKSEKKVKYENTNIEKLEKRVTTIEGLIMTKHLQILEESITPQKPKCEEHPQETK